MKYDKENDPVTGRVLELKLFATSATDELLLTNIDRALNEDGGVIDIKIKGEEFGYQSRLRTTDSDEGEK